MKKFLFLFSALAMAGAFTFCTKESNTPANTETTSTDVPVIDRGGPCDVTVEATGNVMVMGLANNTSPGVTCYGDPLVGVDTGTGPFVYNNVTINYPSRPFSIRNISGNTIQVFVTTSAVTTLSWTLDAGECLPLALATTCLLFSPAPG